MDAEILFDPSGLTLTARTGITLGEAALSAGLPLALPCGGRGGCRNCRVRVMKGDAPATEADRSTFPEDALARGHRLACKLVINGPLTVHYDFGEIKGKNSFGTDAAQQPCYRQATVSLPPPDLAEQTTDAVRLGEALDCPATPSLSLDALTSLGHAVKDRQTEKLSCLIRGNHVIAAGGTAGHAGLALDIGTTTVAGALVSLDTGITLAAMTAWNGQAAFGADVIARIQHCNENANGTDELHKAILNPLRIMIEQLGKQAGIPLKNIAAVTVAGNPTMVHLLLGIPPSGLARSPYVGVVADPMTLQADDLGLPILPSADIYILPAVASNVGGDITAGLIMARMEERDGVTVMVDLGTNAEIVAGNRERMVCCSTAAGPAFEGAMISQGMRARPGAIDRVAYDDNDGLACHIMGGRKPTGICGSGLLDLLAVLLNRGLVDETGMLLKPEALPRETPAPLAARLVTGDQRLRVSVADGVSLLPDDIRQIQLAKGAVAAGINTLLSTLSATASDVSEVLLAGAFGNYLSPDSARRIGLVPPGISRITPMGNAAGQGARMALLCDAARRRGESIVKHIDYVELAGHPDFRAAFAEAMLFSDTGER